MLIQEDAVWAEFVPAFANISGGFFGWKGLKVTDCQKGAMVFCVVHENQHWFNVTSSDSVIFLVVALLAKWPDLLMKKKLNSSNLITEDRRVL